MSFQNFDSFQNQHPAADAAAAAPGAPAPADTAMAGQADPATAPFQGAAGDAAAVPQQSGDGKTTLWYAHYYHVLSTLIRASTDSLQDGRARALDR